MKTSPRLAFLSLLFLLASCTLPTAIQTPHPDFVLVTANPNALPTPTPFQPASSNSIPPEPSTPIATFTQLPPTNTPLPTLAFTATVLPSPTSAPTSSRTQYTMFALLDYYNHQLAVDETISYTNQTGTVLDQLVLAVEPNLRGGFTLENVLLDGNPLNFDLSGQRLTVYLPQSLQPSAQLTLAMRFRISIPAKVRDHPYGYDSAQVNLTDWYPFIVPYSNGWILHDDYYLGEHLVYDSADFQVNIKTTDAGVTIATSGVGEPNGEWTLYRLNGARTFAFSASDQFQFVDAVAGGATIRSYYFPGYDTEGAAILNAAVREIGLFETKFAPFPYGSLSIVQSDLNDGQEYDGLVFLATSFYDQYAPSWSESIRYDLEYRIQDVHIEGVPVKGFIDRIDRVDQSLLVYDYKSGNPDSISKKLKSPAKEDLIGGHYWRQMVFYDLLLMADPKIKRGMSAGYILALEPRKDGSLLERNVHVTEDDRTIVKNQILDTWQKIQRLEFEKGCGECAWCRMHDLNPPLLDKDEDFAD